MPEADFGRQHRIPEPGAFARQDLLEAEPFFRNCCAAWDRFHSESGPPSGTVVLCR
jgi:hypothetical protein